MAEQSRLEIAIDSRGAEANARGVRRELEGMERAGNTATRAARSTAGGFGQIARSSQLAVPPVGQLTALLGGLGGIISARQVVAYSDAWENAGNQLRQVTDSADELAGVQERLMGVANATRSDFGSTADLYSRLARSTTELGLSQSDLIGLTRTINQSMSTSGATAAEAEGAIRQLGQGLASGALRGDEFNSIAEQAPGIMRAIAESLDMTIGELRDFAAEGGITSEIVVTALQRSADAIEKDFGQAVATFGQQMTVARNNMLAFVGGSDTVEEGVANIGEAIVGLSENLDSVGQAATVVAGVFGGRLAGRFITVAAGMTTAAGAATALRTALAFLGGPAGIAVAAATALFAFREELGLVPSVADDARREIDLLTGSLDDLNGSSIDAAMIAINAQMFELERRARDTREALDSLSNSGSGALGMSPGVTGEQSRLLAEQGQIGAERSALSERQKELLALREGTGGASGTTGGDLSSLVPTNEQAGRLRDNMESLADEFGDGSDAVKTFSDSAVAGAQAIESAVSKMPGFANDPRYNIKAGGDTLSERARARFEASAFRVGDASVRTFASDGTARPTYSTALYDSAGSAIPRSPAAGSGSSGGGQHLGTLTLAGKDGGKIDVQANAQELQKFVTSMLSDAASSV